MIETSFEEAAQAFGDFLVAHGWSRSVAWIFRDAATQHRRRLLIDVNATLGAERDAAVAYNVGCRLGLGVRFEAVAEAGGVSFAYVWVPEDKADAEAAMMTGRLRFAVRDTATVTALTQWRWWFALIRLFDRLRGGGVFMREVPQRPPAADSAAVADSTV